MITNAAQRFMKTYVATVSLAVTCLMVGSAVSSPPRQLYIPYLDAAAHTDPAMCAAVKASSLLQSENPSEDTNVTLTIYRTFTHPGCNQTVFLYI